MRHLSAVLVTLVCLSASLTAQGQVWFVDPAGPVTEIRDAVNLAASGDTIMVKPGTYEPFAVIGKSLVIQGDPQATVLNWVLFPFFPGYQGPTVEISGLAAHQQVTLRGLDITLRYQEPVAALEVTGCAGPVHVEDSVVTSSNGPAVRTWFASSLALERCSLESQLGFLPNGQIDYVPMPGLSVDNSKVFVFDTTIRGSDGWDEWALLGYPSSNGGPGAQVKNGLLYLSGSTVTGGQGGDYDSTSIPTGCSTLGDGGTGLVMYEVGGGTPSRTVLFDTTVQGGAGGVQKSDCSQFPDGLPGPDQLVLNGTLSTVPGSAPAFSLDSPVRETATFDLHYEGPPGHDVYLLYSLGLSPGVLFQPGLFVLNVDLGNLFPIYRGMLPASGTLDETLVAPLLPPGFQAASVTGQAVYVDPAQPNAPLLLSGPSVLTVLDGSL